MRKPLVILLGVWVAAMVTAVAAPAQDFLCSAGPHDGQICNSDVDCFVSNTAFGACVLVQGVCDGGDDDGFPCDCPGAACVDGVCSGGPFEAESCDVTNGNCAGGHACVASQRVCDSGSLQAYSCLRDEHCDGAHCVSSGKFCEGGDFADYACIADVDCTGGTCDAPQVGGPACVGDCSGDGEVTVDEIVIGVNIALGTAPAGDCVPFDANGDGEVTVDEILQGVNAALSACPVAASPTPTVVSSQSATPTVTETPPPSATTVPTETTVPTATQTPTLPPIATATETPTPTATGPTATASATGTPQSFGPALAGRAALIANALGVFPAQFTAIITGLRNGSGGGAVDNDSDGGGGAVTASCAAGGQVVRTCTGTAFVTITMSFTGCTLGTPDGTLTFESGSITLRGPGTCPNLVVAAPTLDETLDLSATFRDSHGDPTLLVQAAMTGTVTSLGVDPGSACFLNGGDIILNGTVSAQIPSGPGSRVQFTNTTTRFDIGQFNENCVPVNYTLTFDGSTTVTETASGQAFDVTLNQLAATYDATVSPAQVQLSGGLTAPCVGGTVHFSTEPALSQLPGEPCYRSGVLTATLEGSAGSQRISYHGDGSVGIDTNNDNVDDVTYPTCIAPELLTCGPHE